MGGKVGIFLLFVTFAAAAAVTGQHEVIVLAFGTGGPGLGSVYRSIPIWEMAVERLVKKENNTLSVTFMFAPARNCLLAVEKQADDLAMWYNLLERPGRTIVMISPGSDLGKNV